MLSRYFSRPRRAVIKPDYLFDETVLRQLVIRERARCDRNGTQFALLELHWENTSPDSIRCDSIQCNSIQCLSDVLERRLRSTDIAGIWGESSLAVLLPETDARGAQTVAADIRRLLPEGFDGLSIRIYVYPSQDHDDTYSNESGQQVPASQVSPGEQLFSKKLSHWKRGLDIVGSILGIIVLWPIMLLAMVAIKLTSPGPVLFAQRRTGLGGRAFTMYKFRTMFTNAETLRDTLQHLNEQDGPAFKIRRDPRLTAIGGYLRRTCLDELPQLWNVLKGEMTIVGPRPLPCREAASCSPWQQRRHDVTPGLTCLWQLRARQLNGDLSFQDWMRMDLQYIRRQRIALDLWIILRTAVAVILHRASY